MDGRRGRGVLAICGGVGGAKLALGLYRVLPPDTLTVVANTGDDFEHMGLHVSPDLDTVMYTLAGLANRRRGWGRAGETWSFMGALAALGGDDWFSLGDGDLATHLLRTERLRAGERLSAITADFATRLGLRARLLPMSDDPVRTVVQTPDGPLPFQHYFVRLGCAPRVTGLSYKGARRARPLPALRKALADRSLRAIVVCPSNPYLSVDPILALPGVRAALAAAPAPVVAVSPIIAGRAVKGPAAKIMAELGLPATALTVARHYEGLIDGFVLDSADARSAGHMPVPVTVSRTLMSNLADRDRLARRVLRFADGLAGDKRAAA